jgi:hypothetical protein
MLESILRTKKSLLIGSALAMVAALGLGSFALSALNGREKVSSLTAERDMAVAKHDRLQEAAGELSQVEARLGSARVEYGRVVQGWAEAKAKAGAVQQELANLTKRLDQAKDRVSQTGSIRQAEPPQRPARKP